MLASVVVTASFVYSQEQQPKPAEQQGVQAPAERPRNPFLRRVRAPEFPRDVEWLNSAGPIRLHDLRGKFVLLDFWTYCCINCIHVLPELKKLEHAYPKELVVIGIHSAKFDAEKGPKNIEDAILRYEIEHPVINDAEHHVWNQFGARSWPTVLMIDPEGYAVWGTSGEIEFADVDHLLKAVLPFYRQQGLVDETPVRFHGVADRVQQRTPLRFPGKVLADEEGGRLFISDSNHNRIVIATLDGVLIDVIGNGDAGRQDGRYDTATFDHPQGTALAGDVLYVADTENHLLRKVDLQARQVSTIAGVGRQGRNPWPGAERDGVAPGEGWRGPPRETPLNSPWALAVHNDQLFIAMAGPHQIWSLPLDESAIGPYAGNGREDIVDGPLLPQQPYALGASSFAQPSGLASDGQWLYVADSEGSSIRAVPLDRSQRVRTVVGTSELPYGRLFTFGDRDGDREQVLLQHVLGVTFHEGQLYIADTYNNKVKQVDPVTGRTATLCGTAEPGNSDEPARFDEPAGISYANGRLYIADTNNHSIRTYDLGSGKVDTIEIQGLQPPTAQNDPRPDFSSAVRVDVPPARVRIDGDKVRLQAIIELPEGWKLNPGVSPEFWLRVLAGGESLKAPLPEHGRFKEGRTLELALPVREEGASKLEVSMMFYYCQEGGEGLCRVGSVVWSVPLEATREPRAASEVLLLHRVMAETP